MQTYDQTIQRLMELQKNAAASDTLLSLYLPTAAVVDRDLSTQIRAKILTSLKNYDPAAEFTEAHVRLANHFEKQVLDHDFTAKGLAIFARLPMSEIDRAADADYPELITAMVLPLADPPLNHVYVGQVFDVRPLLHLDRTSIKALVLVLTNDQGQLYSLQHDALAEELTIDNIWSYEGQDESRVEMNMGTAGTVTHGTGQEVIARRQQSGNHMVLNKLTQALKPYLNGPNLWKQLVIFNTSDFNDILENWLEQELHPISDEMTPIVTQTLPDGDEALKDQTRRLIHQQQESHIEALLEKKNEEYHQWATGWKEVTDAVRNRQVTLLLMPPTGHHDGYLLEPGMPYTYPAADSHQVHNLAPWLATIVRQSGGQVVTSPHLSELSDQPVLARLRYVPS